MTDTRFAELMKDDGAELTEAEVCEGWHFCNEFDGLLVNWRDKASEGQFCTSDCRPLETQRRDSIL